MEKIAIVNSSSFGRKYHHHIEELRKIGQVDRFDFDPNIGGEDLAKALCGYNYIISSVTPFFTEEFFQNKDELRLIARHGIGFNNIDLNAAKEHNTIVTIIPALVEREAVAEQNITNLLALMRRVVNSSKSVENDLWENRAEFIGNTLFNKTVGVIGVGNTGSCVAEILRNGFRCNVLGYDPFKTKLELSQFGVFKVELEELLKNSDVICLCASLTDSSFEIINEKSISMMKKGVYISNSARGSLINEEALLKGLDSNIIKGYAADVLVEEPGRATHPIIRHENTLVTPHTGAYTEECLEEMGSKCVRDVLSVLNGILPERAIQTNSVYII